MDAKTFIGFNWKIMGDWEIAVYLSIPLETVVMERTRMGHLREYEKRQMSEEQLSENAAQTVKIRESGR